MDILNIIEYENTYPVKLKHPKTGVDLGIVFNVVSMESERVAAALRSVQRAQMNDDIAGNKTDPELAIDQRQIAMMCAVIESWDWGGKSPGAGLGVDPECTEENKKALLSHINSKWIKEQIAAGCADIGNFMKAE